MNKTPLSDKEIDLIRKHLPNMTVPAFVEKHMPNRSKTSVRRYAAKLNIKYVPMQTAFWSDKEESVIKKYYADKGVDETLFRLRKIGSSKTRKQLMTKACDMNIKLNPELMKKVKSEQRKRFLEKQEARQIMLESARKAAETRRKQMEAETAKQLDVALCYRPKWETEAAKMCFFLLDRHWEGERFEPGTKEYMVLKSYNVIGY